MSDEICEAVRQRCCHTCFQYTCIHASKIMHVYFSVPECSFWIQSSLHEFLHPLLSSGIPEHRLAILNSVGQLPLIAVD